MPTRTIFFHISPFQQALFYLLALLSTTIAAWGVWQHAQVWCKAGLFSKNNLQATLLPTLRNRLLTLLKHSLGHKRILRRRYAGTSHLLLFFGMLVLFIGTCIVAIEHYGSFLFGPHWLYRGWFYLLCKTTLDLFGLGLLVGVSMALLRRLFWRPSSSSSSLGDIAFLVLLLCATLTGFMLEGGGLAADAARHPYWAFSPIGRWFAMLFPNLSPNGYVVLWWVHAPLVLAVVAFLPYGRRFHLIAAPFSILFQPDRPMGTLELETIEKVEQTGRVGYATTSDLSAYQLLSLDACMECGRCTDACPAFAVGKPLDPKQIVLDLRGPSPSLSSAVRTTDVISEEALWACTNCHACVRECPSLIRHVDLIDGIRRYRVAEGRVAGLTASMLRHLASQKNPWGLPSSQRMEWAKGLEVPLATSNHEHEIILWVGCAGAFEPRAQATVRALVRLLEKAQVDFAVLGHRESCTGDPARRVGEEFLFQELAQNAITSLQSVGAKRLLTCCPHCFHTIKNEYPTLGGHFEVFHHTQYLLQLLQEGRLHAPTPTQQIFTYHDPCFLGRVNRETKAPRSLLNSLSTNPLHEPLQHAERTLCCGAGGGRMWMEEPPNKRPSARRAQQLLETNPQIIAVSCPFCKIMLGDTLATSFPQNTPQLADIAELMLAAQENPSTRESPHA